MDVLSDADEPGDSATADDESCWTLWISVLVSGGAWDTIYYGKADNLNPLGTYHFVRTNGYTGPASDFPATLTVSEYA